MGDGHDVMRMDDFNGYDDGWKRWIDCESERAYMSSIPLRITEQT